jgi:type I restriction enzyme M protein
MLFSYCFWSFDELKADIGEDAIADIDKEDFIDLIRDRGQGYNVYIFEHNKMIP